MIEKKKKGKEGGTEGQREILKSLKYGNFKEPEKCSKSGHKFGNLFFSSDYCSPTFLINHTERKPGPFSC